jgi:hypothetical protein
MVDVTIVVLPRRVPEKHDDAPVDVIHDRKGAGAVEAPHHWRGRVAGDGDATDRRARRQRGRCHHRVAVVTVYQEEEAPPLARLTSTPYDVLATTTSTTPSGSALSVHGMLAADDDDTSHDAPDTLAIGTVGVEVSLGPVRKRLVIVRRIAVTHRGRSQFTPAFGATHSHASTTATLAELHDPTAALPQ